MSIVSLVFRCQVQPSEADATYLLSGALIVTYVLNTEVLAPQQSSGSR